MNNPKNLDKDNFKKKTIKIFIHGFLHLLGYDHHKNKDFEKMLKEEKKFLNLLKNYLIKLKKNFLLESFLVLALGSLSSLSLPPLNFFFINFFTLSFFF